MSRKETDLGYPLYRVHLGRWYVDNHRIVQWQIIENYLFLFDLKYVADLSYILRPFWLGADLTVDDLTYADFTVNLYKVEKWNVLMLLQR
jgi:hypothetical protein